MTPPFEGLPDYRCQSPHWGYVVKGKVGYRYADREEIVEAGEAYYALPGHTRQLLCGQRGHRVQLQGRAQEDHGRLDEEHGRSGRRVRLRRDSYSTARR
jgi:hypothetical protein